MKKVTLWDWCHAVFFSQNARHTGTSQLKPCRHCFNNFRLNQISFHAWLLNDLETTFLLNHYAMFSNLRIHRKRFIRDFRNLNFPTTAVPQNPSLAILKDIGNVHKWRHTPEGGQIFCDEGEGPLRNVTSHKSSANLHISKRIQMKYSEQSF